MILKTSYFRTLEMRIMKSFLPQLSNMPYVFDSFAQHLLPREYKTYISTVLTNWNLLRLHCNTQEIEEIDALLQKINLNQDTYPRNVNEELLYLPIDYDQLDVFIPKLSDTSKKLEQLLYASLRSFISSQARKSIESNLPKRLQILKDTLQLNDTEIQLISIMTLVAQRSYLISNWEKDTVVEHLIHVSQQVFGSTTSRFLNAIQQDSRLVKNGILFSSETQSPRVPEIQLNQSIYFYICGKTSHYIEHSLLAPIVPGIYSLSSFPLQPVQIKIAQSILKAKKDKGSILIYGEPGVGKTELIKSLVGSTQNAMVIRKPISLKNFEELQYAAAICKREQKILIFDEAESVLQTPQSISILFQENSMEKKKLVNEFLDNPPTTLVYIVNSIAGIHESTLRRFNQIIHLKKLDKQRRRDLWLKKIEQHDLKVPQEKILQLAEQFDVNPGIIDTALHSAKRVHQSSKLPAIIQTVDSFLETQGKTKKLLTQKIPIKPELIHTDRSLEPLYEHLLPWVRTPQPFGMNLLFWGIPGTGKTEYAKILADRLDFIIRVVQQSDVLSPYLGESERNIAQIFVDAKKNNHLLVFDEADSFLFPRDKATHSWERNIVNEFLSQLDNHTGIVIFTTNTLGYVDKAALRRCTWKYEFKPLKKDQLSPALQFFFPTIIDDFLPGQLNQIQHDQLTLGDFANVYKQFYPSIQLGKPICVHNIIDALREEQKYREFQPDIKVVGFGA